MVNNILTKPLLLQDGTERECDQEVSLLSPHTCSIAQGGSRIGKPGKRKRRDDDNLTSKGMPPQARPALEIDLYNSIQILSYIPCK